MFAYPVLTKRHNLVAVSNTHSGKTLSSVISVLTLLDNDEFYSDVSFVYALIPVKVNLYSLLDVVSSFNHILPSKKRFTLVKTNTSLF